jgi:hypothetical protein
MQWPDRIAAIIVFSVCVFLYIIQRPYPRDGAFFPKVSIISLMLLSINLFIQSWLQKSREGKKTLTFEQEELDMPSESGEHALTGIIKTMGTSLVYIALLPVLGYALATGLFIFVLAIFLGMRKLYIVIPTAAGISISIYLVFKIFLRLPLPEGVVF